MRAIVLADGEPGSRAELDAVWPGWVDDIGFVVAADGGARHAPELGLRVDAWVGDADSIDASDLAALAATGVAVRPAPRDKDESDTELAIAAAVAAGATDVTVLGALGGGRVDHALANVWLLAHPALAGRSARLLAPGARLSLVTGPATARLVGRPGDVVTLLAFDGPAGGITTTGLRFALNGETLVAGPARGLSNERTGEAAAVTLRHGRLLVVEVPARLPS
jgi:thiamine pyrophosphokinase